MATCDHVTDCCGGFFFLLLQMWILAIRFARSWWRSPMMFWSEMADYTVFAIFLGARARRLHWRMRCVRDWHACSLLT